jgi:glutamyl-tRNA reductase
LRTARENCGTATYPLLLLDLSMPRNIDPALSGVPGVTIADLDALHIPVLAAEELRKAAVPAAEALVEAELESFVEWVSAAAAREAIRPLAEALTEICRRELTFAAGDEVAEHATSRIVAKLLARPMTKLRTAVAHGEALHAFTMTLDSLFAGPAPVAVKAPRAKRRVP